jgi:hypothetical protein
MQYDTVTSITPSGEAPYPTQWGLLHSFNVAFASGVTGVVNAKSPAGPSFKVGQQVWFNIQGQTPQGVNRIKVDTKTPPPQMPAVQPPPAVVAPQAQPAARVVPAGEAGPRQGMWVNNAVQIIIHNAKASAEPVILDSLPQLIFDVATLIKEADLALQTGVRPVGEIPF